MADVDKVERLLSASLNAALRNHLLVGEELAVCNALSDGRLPDRALVVLQATLTTHLSSKAR